MEPATGRESWTYSANAPATGPFTIKTRAADDSGRIETPSAGSTLTVGCGP